MVEERKKRRRKKCVCNHTHGQRYSESFYTVNSMKKCNIILQQLFSLVASFLYNAHQLPGDQNTSVSNVTAIV